jgi:hypothetical protein
MSIGISPKLYGGHIGKGVAMSDRSEVHDSQGHATGVDVTTHNQDGSSTTTHYSAHDGLFGACAEKVTSVSVNDAHGHSTDYPRK